MGMRMGSADVTRNQKVIEVTCSKYGTWGKLSQKQGTVNALRNLACGRIWVPVLPYSLLLLLSS